MKHKMAKSKIKVPRLNILLLLSLIILLSFIPKHSQAAPQCCTPYGSGPGDCYSDIPSSDGYGTASKLHFSARGFGSSGKYAWSSLDNPGLATRMNASVAGEGCNGFGGNNSYCQKAMGKCGLTTLKITKGGEAAECKVTINSSFFCNTRTPNVAVGQNAIIDFGGGCADTVGGNIRYDIQGPLGSTANQTFILSDGNVGSFNTTYASTGIYNVIVNASTLGGYNESKTCTVNVTDTPCDAGPASLPATCPPVIPEAAIKANDIICLRSAIDARRSDSRLNVFSWTDPIITPGKTPIRAVHFTEMQRAIKEVYTSCLILVSGPSKYQSSQFTPPFTVSGLVSALISRNCSACSGIPTSGSGTKFRSDQLEYINDNILTDKNLYQRYPDVLLTPTPQDTAMIAQIVANTFNKNELKKFNRSLINRGDPTASPNAGSPPPEPTFPTTITPNSPIRADYLNEIRTAVEEAL